mgnify:CR=1 FL=1
MEHPDPIPAETFRAAWAAEPARRYGYGLNPRVFWLYAVLVSAFWTTWGVQVARDGFDAGLVFVGIVFTAVSLWVAVLVTTWLMIRARSGVVCARDRLIWRYANRCFAVPWQELDVDRLGLVDRMPEEDRWTLRILNQPLPLIGPHLRLKNLDIFLTMVLLTLEENGRLAGPEKADASPARPKKKEKS